MITLALTENWDMKTSGAAAIDQKVACLQHTFKGKPFFDAPVIDMASSGWKGR
jgi:hypothetical protein